MTSKKKERLIKAMLRHVGKIIDYHPRLPHTKAHVDDAYRLLQKEYKQLIEIYANEQ